MSANFAFYIHHHGSGHLMRALSIVSHLGKANVTFLGSGLGRFQNIIPGNIQCIHLPEDVAGSEDPFAATIELSFLHYVPMNVEKAARRTAVITAALHSLFPVVLFVDVSVEVTMIATLCGTPTIVVRQNGDRDDNAHLHAYECAQLLIAPSPQLLINSSAHDWVNKKTFFSGGFSKYSRKEKSVENTDHRAIGVMVGSGGTSIDGKVVKAIAEQCQDRSIHVIGDILKQEKGDATNVIFHGQLDDPVSVLHKCRIVVGNAGHNTVMEMADLGKKFICIPEERPFYEQLSKAELLEKNGMAVVIKPSELENIVWRDAIDKADALHGNFWKGVINKSALPEIAEQLQQVWDHNFPEKLS